MKILDDELGEIWFVKNARSHSVTARIKDGHFHVSYPTYMSERRILEIIGEMKPKLFKLKEKAVSKTVFTPQTQLDTLSFSVQIKESTYANYYIQLKDRVLSIVCPLGSKYEDATVQDMIRNSIENALRSEAKRILPSKVKEFAIEHGFSFENVKINKSRSRWGSCSSKRNINLSYYCLLLPEYLIDFVILHELCHTVEMNHGNHFWILLDKVSGGRSKDLTHALKNFKTQL